MDPSICWEFPKWQANSVVDSTLQHLDVSENSGFSHQIIHFNRVFHYKPSILACPYFWKHPFRVYLTQPLYEVDKKSTPLRRPGELRWLASGACLVMDGQSAYESVSPEKGGKLRIRFDVFVVF